MASRQPHTDPHRGPSTGSTLTAQQTGPTQDGQNAAPSSHAHERESQESTAAGQQPKKRKHRGGKKRRHRRQSFATAPPLEEPDAGEMIGEAPDLLDVPRQSAARSSFYRLDQNRSNTSLDSEALLDHRPHGPLQARRQSLSQGTYLQRGSQPYGRHPSIRPPHNPYHGGSLAQSRKSRPQKDAEDEHEDALEADDKTPLMSSSRQYSPSRSGYGGLNGPSGRGDHISRRSHRSSTSSAKRPAFGAQRSATNLSQSYDVNNPPSMPPSPTLNPEFGFDDPVLAKTPDDQRVPGHHARDVLIDIDEEDHEQYGAQLHSPPRAGVINLAEGDVCFPQEGMSEIGHDDFTQLIEHGHHRPRRRRGRRWPDFSVLEEWSTEEKEGRTLEEVRTRKISEPLLVGGRLRPQKSPWHREDDDAPYRFTYFNEEFQSTIHSQTISELLQPGQTFRDLFRPDPPVLSDDSTDDDVQETTDGGFDDNETDRSKPMSPSNISRHVTRQSSRIEGLRQTSSEEPTGTNTPVQSNAPTSSAAKFKAIRFGPRPIFWLDVLSPTDAEMRVISKAFGIHPLTAEDIMVQEAREKVELFRHYYFVNYRTFEQDTNSEDYLEPVNMYVVVFREGVISFHFSMTPHPANVRRRIRQLSDYLILSSDWISYAIIDDITDVYAPLIEKIEQEVDAIDDDILGVQSSAHEHRPKKPRSDCEKDSDSGSVSDSGRDASSGEFGSEMLMRVGACRKKVMSLYRLLGNKADVIKGFAKRCNEQWEIAPRSEIGLYLGDIQDHIVTMTGNLSHYENLLSRAHGNYLAQINIRMNERSERTNDVLNKLTVLGTIVLPMNIVTGMWGMNVLVPGQEVDSLWWFWGITLGLLMFGGSSFFIAKRVYGIV